MRGCGASAGQGELGGLRPSWGVKGLWAGGLRGVCAMGGALREVEGPGVAGSGAARRCVQGPLPWGRVEVRIWGSG